MSNLQPGNQLDGMTHPPSTVSSKNAQATKTSVLSPLRDGPPRQFFMRAVVPDPPVPVFLAPVL